MTRSNMAGSDILDPADADAEAPVEGERGKSRTANARAYQTLKDAVLSGRFKSGEIVTLRSLSEVLGIGDMAVREALKRLISEGAFEALPNRSARVPVLGKREVGQLSELRSILESKAAVLAAENMTLRQINGLRDLVAEMTASARSGDLEGYRKAHMEFHFSIYRIAENKPLAMLIESLWLRMAPFTSRAIQLIAKTPPDFLRIANNQHGVLIDAFLRRDAVAAQRAMEADHAQLHEFDGLWEETDKRSI